MFNFKHHRVSTAERYQLNENERLFVNSSCAFSGCKVQVKLELFDRKSVSDYTIQPVLLMTDDYYWQRTKHFRTQRG